MKADHRPVQLLGLLLECHCLSSYALLLGLHGEEGLHCLRALMGRNMCLLHFPVVIACLVMGSSSFGEMVLVPL